MALNTLKIDTDANGLSTFAIPFATYVDTRVLAAATAEVHTVPTGAKFVVFTSDMDFYAKPNGAAAISAVDVVDGSASELNPTVRGISGVTTIGLISPIAGTVSMAFYS